MDYLYLKAFHIVAVTAWMAGLFYLPRLFVYHVDAEAGSELSETFKVMERRLLKAIMTPAMLVSWGLGLVLFFAYDSVEWASDHWFHAKFGLVVLLTVFHMVLARWRKDFERDANTRSGRFYRFANEVPTLLLIGIVIMVVVRPF